MQEYSESKQPALSLKDLAEVLVKHYGYKEGFYEVSFEFQIAVGAVGPSQDQTVPGAIIGLHHVGLSKTEVLNHNSVDAALIHKATKRKSNK